MKITLLSAMILGVISSASARDFSPCTKIISDGLREYNISSSSTENLDTVFDNYCRSEADKRDNEWNASINIVVDNIPLGLKGGGADSQSSMMNFCKNYQSTRISHTMDHSYSDKIVGKAYDTFLTCMRIANEDVNVYHTFNGMELANIYVAANINKPVLIDGLSTSGPITCKARGEASDMSESTHIDVTKTINIVCRRSMEKDAAAANRYQEAAVSLSTNVGPYEFLMPAVPSDYEVRTITAELQKRFDLQVAQIREKINLLIPQDVVFLSDGLSVKSGERGVRTVTCPLGWTLKDGGLGPQPNYGPFADVHVNSVPGGFVVDAWNQAGDQRGDQLLLARAVCSKPNILDIK